jgi:Right handed beta helix region
MKRSPISFRAGASALLLATAMAACADQPVHPGRGVRAPEGPSRLVTDACRVSGGQQHFADTIATAVTWTRASSPHRVTWPTYVRNGGRLTIAPGAVVCFGHNGAIEAVDGGRVVARGRDTARILLTGADPSGGWQGLRFRDTPVRASVLANVVIAHVGVADVAVLATDAHPVQVDSSVIRQSGSAARLFAAGSRLFRSRVDTTTDRTRPAVELRGSVFEGSTVRGAAGVGVRVSGSGASLLGGRIVESGGTGLEVETGAPLAAGKPVRVTGGRSYGAELPLDALARVYPTVADQDSLAGNARDTVRVSGGVLRKQFTASSALPWLVTSSVTVDSLGLLAVRSAARLVFLPSTGILARNGGRVSLRGSPAAPVLLTADDPARGWAGIFLQDSVGLPSQVTNARIEHVGRLWNAVAAVDRHPVAIDSTVIRQVGHAATLHAQGSRMSRTRVDTTLTDDGAAVDLASNAKLESTLIRAPAANGIRIRSSSVQVVSCEVRDGDMAGIEMYFAAVPVHNCNLVNNAGAGVLNVTTFSAPGLTNNWWGDPAGPFGPNGDEIVSNVPQNYTPWRTTPYVLPYVP